MVSDDYLSPPFADCISYLLFLIFLHVPSFWLSKTTLTKHHDECALAIASLKIIILIDWLPKFNHGVSSSPSLPAGRGDDDYKKGRLSVASYGTVYGTQYSLQYHTSIKHQKISNMSILI